MASYTEITNKLNFAVAFNPQGAFPLDARSMFASYDAALVAAKSAVEAGSADQGNSKYYIGMRLTVFENDTVTHYTIMPDKSLKEDGGAVAVDEYTISTDDLGNLTLKSFGKEYYKYLPADTIVASDDSHAYPDAMPTAEVGSYVKVADVWYLMGSEGWAVAGSDPREVAEYELTTGWTDGLQPKVIKNADDKYELAWYQPSSTTVEGLSDAIAAAQANIDAVNARLTNEANSIKDSLATETSERKAADEAMAARITLNERDIATIKGDAATEGSIKYEVAQALGPILTNPDETMNSVQELIDWATGHNTDALQMGNNITANTNAISAMQKLIGTLPEGATATDVVAYIQECVAAEKARAEGVESGLDSRLGQVETATTGMKSAAYKDATEFATAAQGALADSAVQEVVAGDVNGHLRVDGVDVKAYELGVASISNLGGVKVDGSSIAAAADGTISVLAVDSSKVTGLNAAIEEAKTAVKQEIAETTGEEYVAKSDVVDSTNVAESVETASSAKVVSEKLFLEALEWKTTM